jgi:alcohol dehydrogenase class IV
VDAGVAHYQDAGCDGVVAFGGGSALDAAKAVALMVGQTRELWEYVDDENWDATKASPPRDCFPPQPCVIWR